MIFIFEDKSFKNKISKIKEKIKLNKINYELIAEKPNFIKIKILHNNIFIDVEIIINKNLNSFLFNKYNNFENVFIVTKEYAIIAKMFQISFFTSNEYLSRVSSNKEKIKRSIDDLYSILKYHIITSRLNSLFYLTYKRSQFLNLHFWIFYYSRNFSIFCDKNLEKIKNYFSFIDSEKISFIYKEVSKIKFNSDFLKIYQIDDFVKKFIFFKNEIIFYFWNEVYRIKNSINFFELNKKRIIVANFKNKEYDLKNIVKDNIIILRDSKNLFYFLKSFMNFSVNNKYNNFVEPIEEYIQISFFKSDVLWNKENILIHNESVFKSNLDINIVNFINHDEISINELKIPISSKGEMLLENLISICYILYSMVVQT